MKYLLIFLCTLALPSLDASGQTETEPRPDQSILDSVQMGFLAIYDFRLVDADSISTQLLRAHPNHPWAGILKVNFYWWQILSGNDSPKLRKEYGQILNRSISTLKQDKKSLSPEDRYAMITLYGFKARLEILEKNYFKVIGLMNSYIANLRVTFGLEKDYEWFNLTSGIYNYYIELAKDNQPILSPYLNLYPKGDREKGIAQLALARDNGANQMLQTEAAYFLLKIYLEDEEDFDQAVLHGKLLTDRYEKNLFFLYLHFKSLLDADKKDEAMKILGRLTVDAPANDQLTEAQQQHFLKLAEADLTAWFLKQSDG